MRKRIMRPARAVVIAAASIAAVACSDYEPMEYNEVLRSEFAKNFEDAFGKISEDQTWDFSSYALRQSGLVWDGYGDTRAGGEPSSVDEIHHDTSYDSSTTEHSEKGTDDAYTNDLAEIYPGNGTGGGWIEVPSTTTGWLDRELPEYKNNAHMGGPFTLFASKDMFIMPIYQGGAYSAWDLYIDTYGNAYRLWGKSEDIEIKIHTDITPHGETGSVSNKADASQNYQYFRYVEGFTLKDTSVGNSINADGSFTTNKVLTDDDQWVSPKFNPGEGDEYVINCKTINPNKNLNDHIYGIGENYIGNDAWAITKYYYEENGAISKYTAPDGDKDYGIQKEITTYYNDSTKPQSYRRPHKVISIDKEYDKTQQTITEIKEFTYDFPTEKQGFREVYNRWPGNWNVLLQDNGFYANTMAWGGLALQENFRNKPKDVRSKVMRLKSSAIRDNSGKTETEAKDEYRLYLKLTKSGVSGVGTKQWSDDGQMISLDGAALNNLVTSDLKTKMAECINSYKANGESDITASDVQYMVIGCEVGTLSNTDTDRDFNDVVFLVFGREIKKRETVKKRYFIEDMGSAYDFDFNDIVVDVEETATKINGEVDDVNHNFTQKATVRHLCGTRPFQVLIGNDPKETVNSGLTFERIEGQGAQHQSKYGVSYGVTSGGTVKNGYTYTLTHTNVGQGNEKNRRLWDPATNNIKVRVYKRMDEAGYNAEDNNKYYSGEQADVMANAVITFPETGSKTPFIFATDQNVWWTKENVRIPRNWLEYHYDNKISIPFWSDNLNSYERNSEETNASIPDGYICYKDFEQMEGSHSYSSETLNGVVNLMLGHFGTYQNQSGSLDVYLWVPGGMAFQNAKFRTIVNGVNYNSRPISINNSSGTGRYYKMSIDGDVASSLTGNAQLYFVIENSARNINNSNYIFNSADYKCDKMRIYVRTVKKEADITVPEFVPLYGGTHSFDANNGHKGIVLENLPNLQTGGTLRITGEANNSSNPEVKILIVKDSWTESESWAKYCDTYDGITAKNVTFYQNATDGEGNKYVEVPLTEKDIEAINANHKLVIQGYNITIKRVDYYGRCQRVKFGSTNTVLLWQGVKDFTWGTTLLIESKDVKDNSVTFAEDGILKIYNGASRDAEIKLTRVEAWSDTGTEANNWKDQAHLDGFVKGHEGTDYKEKLPANGVYEYKFKSEDIDDIYYNQLGEYKGQFWIRSNDAVITRVEYVAPQ